MNHQTGPPIHHPSSSSFLLCWVALHLLLLHTFLSTHSPQFSIGDRHKYRLPTLHLLRGAVRRSPSSVTGAAAGTASADTQATHSTSSPSHHSSAQPADLPQFPNQWHEDAVGLRQCRQRGLADGRVQRIEPVRGLCRVGGS